MVRKKMIWVAAEDVHTRVVGSLKSYQHKRKLANDPSYRKMAARAVSQPTTLRAMLGVEEGYKDAEGTGHLVLGSMSEMFGESPSPMREALGLV